MKKSLKILAGVLLMVMIAVFLTACGGGGGSGSSSGGSGGSGGGGNGGGTLTGNWSGSWSSSNNNDGTGSGTISASLTDEYGMVKGTVTFGNSPCGISTLNVEGPVDISSYTVDLVSPGITSKRAGLSATFASTPMTGTYSLLNTDMTLYEGTYGFNCFNQGTFSMSKD